MIYSIFWDAMRLQYYVKKNCSYDKWITKTNDAVCGRLRYQEEKQQKGSKLLQDHSLKIGKTCETCGTNAMIPSRKCHHMVYYFYPVFISVIPALCWDVFTIKEISHISQRKCGCIFSVSWNTCDTCGSVFTTVSVSHGWFGQDCGLLT